MCTYVCVCVCVYYVYTRAQAHVRVCVCRLDIHLHESHASATKSSKYGGIEATLMRSASGEITDRKSVNNFAAQSETQTLLAIGVTRISLLLFDLLLLLLLIHRRGFRMSPRASSIDRSHERPRDPHNRIRTLPTSQKESPFVPYVHSRE